jgi:small-conductance mechanosensitive channel
VTPEDAEVAHVGRFVLAVSACLYGAVVLLAYSVLHRFAYAGWAWITLTSVIDEPSFHRAGLQRLVGWLWKVPLWGALLVTALLLILLVDRAGRQRSHRESS